MLHDDRVGVSEWTKINKKKCIKRMWFLSLLFFFYVCNGYHDILMMSVNLNDVAILNIKGADYCGIISGIRQIDAVDVLQNANLTKKRGILSR